MKHAFLTLTALSTLAPLNPFAAGDVTVALGSGNRLEVTGDAAAELRVPFLGDVPITIPIRENGDAGKTDSNFENPTAAPYLEKVCYNLVRGMGKLHTHEPPTLQLRAA